MVFVTDLVLFINIALCGIILILGILTYVKKGEMSALLIGIAFGLFAISHIYTLLGFGIAWEGAMITARTSGYIFVIAALILFLKRGT